MNDRPEIFKINLIVGGIDSESEPNALENFVHELSMRPHIYNARVSWVDENKKDLAISLETEGIGSNLTSKSMAEELLGVSVAVLRKVDGIHVDITGVEVVNTI
jgi:hypothetical protein